MASSPEDFAEHDSYLSISRLPTKTLQQRETLEGHITLWLSRMQSKHWERALGWFTNYSFVTGNQYPRWTWDGSTLTDGPTVTGPGGSHGASVQPSTSIDQFIPKTVDNKLIRPYEANISLLTETRPVPRVVPNSGNAMDEEGASLAEVVFNVLWEDLNYPALLRGLGAELCIVGTSFLETTYGETGVPELIPELSMQDNPLFAGMEGQEPPKVAAPTGKKRVEMKRDVRARVFNGFQVQPDPAATDRADSITWLCRSTYEDIDWIREEYAKDEEGYFPKILDEIGEEHGKSHPLYWWERVKDMTDGQHGGRSGGSFSSGSSSMPNQTLLRVIDVRPNRQFPKGRTLITAGGKLIYAGDARAWSEKYPQRWNPYAIFRFWRVPGRFWGAPLLSHLTPLQARINAIDSLVQMNRELLSIGQWLIPTGAKIPDGYITADPGQHIYYKITPSGQKPERVQHQSIPQELLIERVTLSQQIDDIAGTNPALEGAGKSGVRAGVMMDFIKREQMKAKSAMLQGFEDSLQDAAQQLLMEVSLNMDIEQSDLTERVRAAAREYSSASFSSFAKMSLRDNVNIRIDIASQLMTSPEAKQQKAIEFLQFAGKQMNEEERITIAKAIGFSDFEKRDNPHVSRATKMVARITSGMTEYAFPMPGIDNASIFAPVFQNAILDDRFIEYPKEVKQKLMQLFQYYVQEVQFQQAQAEKKQIQMLTIQEQIKAHAPAEAKAKYEPKESPPGDESPEPEGQEEKEPPGDE